MQFQFGCNRAVALPEYTGAVVSPHTQYISLLFELLTRTVEVALKYDFIYPSGYAQKRKSNPSETVPVS